MYYKGCHLHGWQQISDEMAVDLIPGFSAVRFPNAAVKESLELIYI